MEKKATIYLINGVKLQGEVKIPKFYEDDSSYVILDGNQKVFLHAIATIKYED